MFDQFGIKPKRYAFIGASDGNYAGISLFLSPINQFDEIFYEDYLVININHPLERYYERLSELDPHYLTGYPSAVKILAELQREGKIDISPQTIVCGGEPFSKNEREYIAETWNVKPINYYAASEFLLIGVQQPEDSGLYIFDDLNYIEIKEDRTLLTNLYNYTQPLIRYELSDILTPLNGQIKGQQGRWPFNMVQEIIGRSEEMLWFEKEEGSWNFIHPIVLVEFYVKGLKKFKVIQTGKKSFEFKAITNSDQKTARIKQKIAHKLNNLLEQKELAHVKFNIEVVDRIKRDQESGKYRLIEARDF